MTFLKEKGIHLEVCPTSNVQTNVVDQIKDHPADKIYKTGISMGINTDARTISNTTLTREYNLLADHFQWTVEDLKKCNLEAIEKSFADEQTKAAVKEMIQAAYK
jgi:adenosine deaminase